MMFFARFSLPKNIKIVDRKHHLTYAKYSKELMLSDSLTTENLRKKFKNNFDLCNFAINIGRNIVLSNSQATLNEIVNSVEERAQENVDSWPKKS